MNSSPTIRKSVGFRPCSFWHLWSLNMDPLPGSSCPEAKHVKWEKHQRGTPPGLHFTMFLEYPIMWKYVCFIVRLNFAQHPTRQYVKTIPFGYSSTLGVYPLNRVILFSKEKTTNDTKNIFRQYSVKTMCPIKIIRFYIQI